MSSSSSSSNSNSNPEQEIHEIDEILDDSSGKKLNALKQFNKIGQKINFDNNTTFLKIKWSGSDPRTGIPWANTWEPVSVINESSSEAVAEYYASKQIPQTGPNSKNTVIYVRKSTNSSELEGSNGVDATEASLDLQNQACQDYVNNHNVSRNEQHKLNLCGTYSDVHSAFRDSDKRQGLQEMFYDINNGIIHQNVIGTISHVIFYNESRLSRNRAYGEKVMDFFRQKQITVHFVEPNYIYDIYNPEIKSRFLHNMIDAQKFSEEKSKRSKLNAFLQKLRGDDTRNAKYWEERVSEPMNEIKRYTCPITGQINKMYNCKYRRINKLTRDPSKKLILREIKKQKRIMTQNNIPQIPSKISKNLNNRGYRYKNGKPWTPYQTRTILNWMDSDLSTEELALFNEDQNQNQDQNQDEEINIETNNNNNNNNNYNNNNTIVLQSTAPSSSMITEL